jgi:DNA polymerase/3'-5' exonuclease PolX
MPKDGKRFSRKKAEAVTAKIAPILKSSNLKYEVCGSYRRNSPDVGDIDILVTGSELDQNFNDKLKKLKVKIDWSGSDKVGFQLDGIHVDIKHVPEESWGAGLLHHTGPWGFNIKCRSLAKKKGWILNEYGLYDRDDREIIAKAKTELEILCCLMNAESAARYLDPSERKTPSWLEKKTSKKS